MSDFYFFYSSSHPFSNWYRSSFTHKGVRYNCSEQYMMHMKALMFGDEEVAALIMKAKDAYTQKKLGREVRGFNKKVWDSKCKSIMVEGLVSKFSQDEYCKKTLLETGDKELVEASPTDTIWGVGLAEGDPLINSKSNWRGTNWLGEVLMSTREQLRAG